MRTCADRIPEDQLLTENAWRMILAEILYYCKPYLDVDTEVTIEKLFYHSDREKNELFSNFLTKKLTLKKDFLGALSANHHQCPVCLHKSTIPADLPDEVWAYNLRRGARLSDEQRRLMHQWDTGPLNSSKLQALLLKLDRTESLVAQQLAQGPEYKTAMEATVTQTTSQAEPSSVFAGFASPSQTDGTVNYPDSFQSFLAGGQAAPPPEQPGVDDYEYEFDEDSLDDFDHAVFDDDGQRIVDEEGETLIPFDPEKEFDEMSSCFLSAWAGSYKEIRGQLQATRKGHDQKVVGRAKGGGKGGKSSMKFSVKSKFFKPGSAPRGVLTDRKTPFKDKVGGKNFRGTGKQLMDRTKCFR